MYERFRNEFMASIATLPQAQLDAVMRVLDRTATKYEFKPKETQLAVYVNDLPETAKAYLVVKKLAGLSDATLERYRITLGLFFRYVQKQPEHIKTNDIRMFLFAYKNEHDISMSTLNKYRECISGFFAWACDEEYITTNPAKKVPPIKYEKKSRVALTPIELEYLRAACSTPRENAIVEVLFSTGCRVSELTALKISDVDWNDKSVHLFGKGNKHRTSFLNARAEVALKKYLSKRQDECEYLFVSTRRPYRVMSKDGIEKIMRQISSRASLGQDKVVTPHVLRHTTATTALHRGMPLADISKLLGHEKIDTTMVYAKASLDNVRTGHNKYIS